MDNEQTREVSRLRKLLRRMMDLADHVEQTGSFESGAHDSVRRYNAIVERLEDMNVISENTFPRLDEDAAFGRLGAECTLLAGYLEDLTEEDDPEDMRPDRRGRRDRDRPGRQKRVDIGELVALAPFMASEDLHKLLHSHFDSKNKNVQSEDEDDQKPDMKQLIALAPHMASEDLEQLVTACLTRDPRLNTKYLTALAPHLSSKALGRILREYLPEWFEEKSEAKEAEAEMPQPEEEPTVNNRTQLEVYNPTPPNTLVQRESDRNYPPI